MTLSTLRAPLLLAFGLAMLPPAFAQSGRDGAAAATGGQVERRIERIRIEDAGARIDELRVGGETQSITVSPKGGMPAYEVAPATANHSPAPQGRAGSAGTGGNRVWKVLDF